MYLHVHFKSTLLFSILILAGFVFASCGAQSETAYKKQQSSPEKAISKSTTDSISERSSDMTAVDKKQDKGQGAAQPGGFSPVKDPDIKDPIADNGEEVQVRQDGV